MAVPTGGTCAIIGPSGCGKSTLLKVTAGIIKDYEGTVEINGQKIMPARQKIGFIPQNYGLLPWRTVAENIALASKLKNKGKTDAVALSGLMELLGLAGLGNRYPGELSGGQQQRVSLARAFFLQPDVLLMDEPFSALDAITREEMQDVFLALWEKYAVSTMIVTHYVEEAIYLGQTIIVLSANPGRVYRIIENPLFGGRDLRQQKAFFEMGRELRNLLKQDGGRV
jgi:ABC-type nitrate/sulfonate/bicarbonate transport system, ATPase component